VRRIDKSGTGMVSMADFKEAFHKPGESLEGGQGLAQLMVEDSSLGRASVQNLTVPPKRMAELRDLGKAAAASVTQQVGMDVVMKDVKGIKIKTQVQSSLTPMWDSRVIGTRVNVSIWAPSIKAGAEKAMLTRNRDRVSLGHYAVVGLKDPSKDKELKETVMALEITDQAVTRFGSVGAASKHLAGAIERLLPHPLRFKQVWNTLGKRTEQHVFVWQAVPPSESFVALGMVTTADDNPPPLTSMRCVPLRWCRPAPPPRLLWDDAGTGGKRGALWVVNHMGLLAVGKGSEPPRERYYDLKEERFFINADDLAVLRDEVLAVSGHGPGSPHASESTIPAPELV
jgi:hypothetical protein